MSHGPLATLGFGLQHVLAMFAGIVTPPLVVAGAIGLSAEHTALPVAMAVLTSGLTTFLQVRRIGPVGSGLLAVQGASLGGWPWSSAPPWPRPPARCCSPGCWARCVAGSRRWSPAPSWR